MENIVSYKGRPYTRCGYNLYVNNYGIGAVRFADIKISSFSTKRGLKFIKWHQRKSDRKKYIIVDRESFDLDRLICTYCGDCNGFNGQDGRAREIKYLDGDFGHCYQSNLEWILRPHIIDPKTGMRLIELNLKDAKITVYENGDIFRDGQKKTPGYLFIDSDTNQWYAAEPCMNFVWQGERYYVDSLMQMANFVNGDERLMQNPVILHRDRNFLNFASDNLEWCEASDPRYADYMKKRHQDMQALVDDEQKKQG